MIAIKSNKKLQFPPAYTGYIKMEIDLIQFKPKEKCFELRIIDTCFDIIDQPIIEYDENQQPIESTKTIPTYTVLGTPFYRPIKTYTYDELAKLAKVLGLKFDPKQTAPETIELLFKKGLLLKTQLECNSATDTSKPMYFSAAEDWELIND